MAVGCEVALTAASRYTEIKAAKGFNHPVQLLEYGDAGHAVFGPPADPASPNYKNLGSLGGSPDGGKAARQDDWPRAMAFTDGALKR